MLSTSFSHFSSPALSTRLDTHWLLQRNSILCAANLLPPISRIPSCYSDNIPILSAGVAILFIVPGAFVTLPSSEISLLSPPRRLRVACAGVWHNVWLAALAYLLSAKGFGLTHWAESRSWWKDVSDTGVAVQWVDSVRAVEAFPALSKVVDSHVDE
jgi:hypothetical protein